VAPAGIVPLLSPAMVAAFAWLAIGLGHRRAPGHA
jgi:ABC-type Fe3+ transport system permease subunit